MFDPLAATGQESPAPIYPCDVPPGYPKRIVIETLPKMGTTWRFVESAARAPGMSGEGSWPRLAMVCGERIVLAEDQWDIYKLDPAYDCYVPEFPHPPVIGRKQSNTTDFGDPEAKRIYERVGCTEFFQGRRGSRRCGAPRLRSS
ncbi:hypothetical protein C8Q76DRAFT_799171 [Earliella scabrosa]|nr:hypothetical protein C8Q76DRAFT_799171 [Earliella scabrosa]